MKKTVSLILTLILLMGTLACFPVSAAEAQGKWVGTWSASAVDFYISLEDYLSGVYVNGALTAGTTSRTQLQVTLPGTKLRIKLSNEYGEMDVRISDVTVAKTNPDRRCSIFTETLKPLTFSGKKDVVIPAGETVWSDEVDMVVGSLDKLSVSMFFPVDTHIKTAGLFGGDTFVSNGILSMTNDRSIVTGSQMNIASGVNTYHVIPFLTNIDVYTDNADAYSAVFIGDSTLTNSCCSYVAKKLARAGLENIGILNQAIMGNRLLHKGTGIIGNLYGDALINRYTRDALNQTGVKKIFVKIGVNDILHPSSKSMGKMAPYSSTQELISAYEQLVSAAHSKGLEIYFMEITPWNGYERDILGAKGDIVWTQELQNACNVLNTWIRTNTVADGYVDSSALAAAEDGTKLCPQLTKDGIHLNDLGAMVLADSIPLSFFGYDNGKKADDMSEILGIDPFTSKFGSVGKLRLKLENVMIFIRQLLSSMRIEIEPIRDAFLGAIATLPQMNLLRR